MADFVVIDGDQAIFQPSFGAAVVSVRPGRLTGSGPATHQGKRLCVDGDEGSVEVPGCMYVAPPFVIPGTGTLEIQALAGDQVATKDRTGGTPLMLVGSQFVARFKIDAPAMMPPPASVPDPSPQYPGTGIFTTTNTKLRAT